MFGHHWPEATRKRSREEEEAEVGTLGFTEHRHKRLQALPLRTSPNTKRWSHPPSFPPSNAGPTTVTPGDSDSEEASQQPKSHFSPWSSSPGFSHVQQPSPNPAMDVDRDMDMMDEGGHSALHLEPGSMQPDPVAPNINGRMPTPIHCTFAAQVKGNVWNAGQGVQAVASNPTGNHAFGQSPAPLSSSDDRSVPRSWEDSQEWTMVQNRRLPSPISESGGEEPPASPGMVLDSDMKHPNLVRTPSHPTAGSNSADLSMEMDIASAPATPAPGSSPPPRKFGHMRSKHTLNSWTQQAGMKKSFSIGYRADCEKCRQKIPGHFNHIIIS